MEGPWTRFPRATLGTCEPDVGGWIVHPIETISAVGYLVVAVWLWRQYGRMDQDLPVRYLPALLASAGLGSLLFHASYAAPFQALDLAALAPLTGFLLATALVRRYPTLEPRLYQVVAILAIGGALLPFIMLWLGFVGVGVQTGLVIVLAVAHDSPAEARVPLRRAVQLVLAGGALLTLDHAGIGCVGGTLAHIVQPHALWHLFSAAACFYFYRYERRTGVPAPRASAR